MMLAAALAFAYLAGSLSFAVLVSRAMGLPDPRSYGSGNPGATNVLRSGRRVAAALTLAGDVLKGFLAVLAAQAITGETMPDSVALPAAGLAAFLGHLYPVFHRFAGGKGVATAGGVLFGIDPWLGLGTAVSWLAIALFFRLSSLAALVAAGFAVFFSFWLFGLRPVLPAVAAVALLLVWRHRDNIRRLLAGEENRIGSGRA